MNQMIGIREVKYLGGGKFSVRLSIEAPEGSIARTQTVSAQDRDDAIRIAMDSFSRWLAQLTDHAIRNMPSRTKN